MRSSFSDEEEEEEDDDGIEVGFLAVSVRCRILSLLRLRLFKDRPR